MMSPAPPMPLAVANVREPLYVLASTPLFVSAPLPAPVPDRMSGVLVDEVNPPRSNTPPEDTVSEFMENAPKSGSLIPRAPALPRSKVPCETVKLPRYWLPPESVN